VSDAAPLPLLVTAREAAALLNRSVSTIRYWHWKGDLRSAGQHTLNHVHSFRLADVVKLDSERPRCKRGASEAELKLVLAELRAANRLRAA
jgi:hypothetical protein